MPGDDPAVIGLVLAGGQSRRFGRDKAAVRIGGRTLLDRTVHLLQECLPRVCVSVRPDQQNQPDRRRHALILDRYADLGPVSGMLSAHEESPLAAWLVVACDLPRLDRLTLDTILGARDPRYSAVAYRSAGDGLPEPLCAVYEPGTLAAFRRRIRGGASPGVRGLLMESNVRLIDLPRKDALLNMNTAEEPGQGLQEES